jgi:hypothetical protein
MLNATPDAVFVGKLAGLAYLTPKPAFQGYADINGVTSCAIAIYCFLIVENPNPIAFNKPKLDIKGIFVP